MITAPKWRVVWWFEFIQVIFNKKSPLTVYNGSWKITRKATPIKYVFRKLLFNYNLIMTSDRVLMWFQNIRTKYCCMQRYNCKTVQLKLPNSNFQGPTIFVRVREFRVYTFDVFKYQILIYLYVGGDVLIYFQNFLPVFFFGM